MKRKTFGKEYRHKVASLRRCHEKWKKDNTRLRHFWTMHRFKNLINIKGSPHRIKYTYTHHRGFCIQFQGFSIRMSQGSRNLGNTGPYVGWIRVGYVQNENLFQKKEELSYLTHYTKRYSKFIKKINNFSTIKYQGNYFYNVEQV